VSGLEVLGLSLLAGVILLGALGTVISKDLVRAVLWLALTLVATAGIYLKLLAGFLAGTQVLLYAGGVITLAIFAVMLSQRVEGAGVRQESRGLVVGALAAIAVGGVLVAGILAAPLAAAAAVPPPSVTDLAASFMGEFLLPFEVLSVLLVAVMVAAITIARRTDP